MQDQRSRAIEVTGGRRVSAHAADPRDLSMRALELAVSALALAAAILLFVR